MYIDNEAKLKIDLIPLSDIDENTYYIGKLKFPGKITFNRGVLFMVFMDHDSEVLQISPTDRIPQKGKALYRPSGRIHVDMMSKQDSNGKTYYTGNAKGLCSINCTDGVFFTFFKSKEGEEELQISSLHKNKTDESELIIDLKKQSDSDNNIFFMGKLQYPGSLDWHKGILFTLVIDEEDPYLQVSQLHDLKLLSNFRQRSFIDNKIHVGLIRTNDPNQMIGAVKCPVNSDIDCSEGLFFTIFTAKLGDEEIQISKLKSLHQLKSKTFPMKDNVEIEVKDIKKIVNE